MSIDSHLMRIHEGKTPSFAHFGRNCASKFITFNMHAGGGKTEVRTPVISQKNKCKQSDYLSNWCQIFIFSSMLIFYHMGCLTRTKAYNMAKWYKVHLTTIAWHITRQQSNQYSTFFFFAHKKIKNNNSTQILESESCRNIHLSLWVYENKPNVTLFHLSET